MFCPYCGKKVNEGVYLCPECNSNLDSLNRPTNYKCDNCGSFVPKDAKFCSNCGDILVEVVESETKERVTTDRPVGIGYFSFRKMISTLLIKVIYIVGLISITYGGIRLIVAGVDKHDGEVFVLGGIALLILGNIIWRILCEGWILIFSIHDILGSIEKEIKKK